MVRLALLSVLALAIPVSVAFGADDTRRCLRYSDLNGIHKVDQQTLIAKAKGGGRYKIAVDAQCRYLEWPQDYFETRNETPFECVRPGDALVLHRGGNCFVQSVTPMDETSTQ